MLTNERLEELRHQHEGWLLKSSQISSGQYCDSKAVIELISEIDRLRAELLDARKENYADDFNFECDKRRELQTELEKCRQERDQLRAENEEVRQIAHDMKSLANKAGDLIAGVEKENHRLNEYAKHLQTELGDSIEYQIKLKERIKFIKEHAKEMEIGLKWAAQQFLAEQWGSEEHCDGNHNHWKLCGNHIKDCLNVWTQALMLDDEAEKQK